MRILSPSILILPLLCLALTGCLQEDRAPSGRDAELKNERRYAGYGYDHPATIDIGVQPLSVPESAVSELLARDRTLAGQLEEKNLALKPLPFYKGGDIYRLMSEGKLEAGILGDMYAISAAADGKIVIVALVKQGFSSIVSREQLLVKGLKGKRVATALGSVAHYTLLNALKNEGMTEQDIDLVGMEVSAMPRALERKEIDAFSAWEPTPSITLDLHPGFQLVHRGTSFRFLCFRRDFVASHPEATRYIAASVARALHWMREPGVLDQVAPLVSASAAEFQGEPLHLKPEQTAALIRNDLLQIPAAPQIPERLLRENELLWNEFRYLKQAELIPADRPWSRVRDSFDTGMLRGVLADGRSYHLERYDYRSEPVKDGVK